MPRLIASVAAAAAAALAIAAPAGAAEIVADNGFRPDPNGFSFANYGTSKSSGLQPDDMRRLFGSRVCASVDGGVCELTTPAEAWMNEQNAGMDGGHCFGFATLAQLRYGGHEMGLGAGPTFGLALKGNTLLQREIAYTYVWQTLPSMTDRVLSGTPNQLLRQLVRRLKPDADQLWTIAVIEPKIGGHAITPFAVEDRGAGRSDVLVYDNNWPGRTRRVQFDTNRNTFRYNGLLNPKSKELLFRGTAKRKRMFLFPTTPGLGVQECSFCPPGGPAATSRRFNEISLEADRVNHAEIVAIDRQGRRTGVVDGREVNEIPGASIRYPLAASLDQPGGPDPTLRIPATTPVRVLLDGRPLRTADRELVTLTGPGYSVTVEGIHLRPGERNEMRVDPRGDAVAYTTQEGQDESPTVQLGLARRGGEDLALALQAITAPGGSTVRVARDADRERVRFHSNAQRTERYVVVVTETSKRGEHDFAAAVRLHPGERAMLDYRSLTRRTTALPLVVTGADGERRTVSVPRVD